MTGAALIQELRDLGDIIRRHAPVLAAVAFFVAAFDGTRAITPAIVLGVAYLVGPYALLIHGVDALVDPDEGTVRLRRVSIAVANLPPLIVLVALGGAGAGLALALALGVAVAMGLPQGRSVASAAVRLTIELASAALLVVLPAIAGAFVGGRAAGELPWIPLLALTGWVVAAAALRAPAMGSVTAVVALVGFFLGAALTAATGPLGALGAFGLDLYLLLPAMLLTADRASEGSLERATERALGSRRHLDPLVGAWLAVLLTRHWGLWTTDILVVLIVLAGILTAFAVLNVILMRIAIHRRRLPETAWDADIPSLTMVVPCLDDGDRLDATIASLRDQTYADATILVVDGGSSDGSPDLAAELVVHDGTVITAGEPAMGWSIRRWSRRVGAEAATTDLLLFVEPGTVLVPVAVRKVVEHLQRSGDTLVSTVIGREMRTWTERAAVPGFTLFRSAFVPGWLSALTHGRPPSLARAPGGLLLVSRAAYLAAVSGTEDAPAPADASDDAIAQAIARAGGRVGVADGVDVGGVRRERTYGAVIATWRRALLPAVGGSLALAVLAMLAGIVAFLVPLVLPFAALVSGAEPRLLLVSCAPLFLLLAFRVAITLTQRQSLMTILTHPVTVAVAFVGQVAAIVDHVTGRPRD